LALVAECKLDCGAKDKIRGDLVGPDHIHSVSLGPRLQCFMSVRRWARKASLQQKESN